MSIFQTQPDAGYGAKASTSGGSGATLVLGVGAWQVVEPHRYLVSLSGGAALGVTHAPPFPLPFDFLVTHDQFPRQARDKHNEN